MLGFVGVLIVLLSVSSSIGLLCFLGVRSTLIIVEVIPFLVLAVGVDNIFIFVQHFDRIQSKNKDADYREQLKSRLEQLLHSVAPSILLAACAESSCFFIGAITPMPAVRIFAINAGMALLFSFIFQLLIFIPLLAFDAQRQDQYRLEIAYWIRSKKSFNLEKNKLDNSQNEQTDEELNKGLLYKFFREIFAPFLMKNWVRMMVVLVFSGWLCLSISFIHRIDVGLEQKYSMPIDSYVLKFFDAQINKLKIGPPVYFILKADRNFNYSNNQNLLCSSSSCSNYSVVNLLSQAAQQSAQSYIVDQMPYSWIDEYQEWANSPCCRLFKNDSKFCPSTCNFALLI